MVNTEYCKRNLVIFYEMEGEILFYKFNTDFCIL